MSVMGKQKFLKGDFVDILPEFRDPGDDEYQWVVLDDEEKGRVSISATNSTLRITPVHVVQTDWICHKKRSVDIGAGVGEVSRPISKSR